ncbi:MAG: SWIM zinc finger family protein [Egibacteraceae bacterium]
MTDLITSAFSSLIMGTSCHEESLSYASAYAEAGRVGELAACEGRLTGTVGGLVPHRAQMWIDGGKPAWSCTCPVAGDGLFCGHCIAVVDAYERKLAEQDIDDDEDDEDEDEREDSAIRAYLHGLEPERLVELVMEQASSSWRLWERLTARRASSVGSTINLDLWRGRLERAFETGGVVERERTLQWWREIQETIDVLEGLAGLGQADAVTTLTEYACELFEKAAPQVEDSQPWLGSISARIGHMHLRACEQTRPDPAALAEQLVELELRFPLGVFYQAALRYAGLLGDMGLTEYRRLLRLRFDADSASAAESEDERFTVTKALAGVARAMGDPDELIAVKAHDLVIPGDYGEVASLLADAGRVEEAVDWVHRGLAAFDRRPWSDWSVGLYELLVGLHRLRSETAGVTEALWGVFTAGPSVEAYQQLLLQPEVADDVEAWRGRVLEHLRDRDDVLADGSALAGILAYEGAFDEAWAVAEKEGCNRKLRWMLARARERSHPEDAIGVYKQEVESWIDMHTTASYRHAVRLMTWIERAYRALGRPQDFGAYASRLRARHHERLDFVILLGKQGWWPHPQ